MDKGFKCGVSRKLAIGLGAIVIMMSFAAISFLNKGADKTTALLTSSGKIGTSIDDIAPVFSLNDIEGRKVGLGELKGRAVYLLYTTSWCTPCQIEAQNMRKVQNELDKEKVAAIVIMVDPNEPLEALRWWKRNFGNPDWYVAYNNNAEDSATTYNVRALDTSYIVNKHGVIIYKDTWLADYPTLKAKAGEALVTQVTVAEKEMLGIGTLGGVHEHVDFKVYLDGRPVDFSQNKYQVRSQFAHVEGGNGNVVHMHATGITLGYFFESLGMKFNKTCFVLDTGEDFCNSGEKTLKLFVNGMLDSAYGDYLLEDLDKILISYGKGIGDGISLQLGAITDEARIFSTAANPAG